MLLLGIKLRSKYLKYANLICSSKWTKQQNRGCCYAWLPGFGGPLFSVMPTWGLIHGVVQVTTKSTFFIHKGNLWLLTQGAMTLLGCITYDLVHLALWNICGRSETDKLVKRMATRSQFHALLCCEISQNKINNATHVHFALSVWPQ